MRPKLNRVLWFVRLFLMSMSLVTVLITIELLQPAGGPRLPSGEKAVDHSESGISAHIETSPSIDRANAVDKNAANR